LKITLTMTLNCIKHTLNGYPTVLWSGRGFHIVQPIDCPVDLSRVQNFRSYPMTQTLTLSALQKVTYQEIGMTKATIHLCGLVCFEYLTALIESVKKQG